MIVLKDSDTSYLLVSAATVLLRCTVECGDLRSKRLCTTKLVQFRNRLQQAQRESDWDLANFCLERCHEPIQKIAGALGIHSSSDPFPPPSTSAVSTQNTETLPRQERLEEIQDLPVQLPDVFLPIDSLDFPWETMWDSFDGPWPIQI
jgi:hypothetical protein